MWMGHCIKPLFSADEEETGVYLLQAERAENSALFFFVCLFFFSIKKNKLGRKRNLIAAQIELFPRFLHRLLRRITFLLNKNVIEVSTWKILSLAKMFPGPRKGTKIMQKSSRLLLFFFFFHGILNQKGLPIMHLCISFLWFGGGERGDLWYQRSYAGVLQQHVCC